MTEPSAGPPRRVLLVDDSLPDRAMVRDLLGAIATETCILEAPTVASGMHVLRSQPVDLVLLDLGLPDAKGTEALAVLLSMQSAPPIIVLTGGDEDVLGESSLRMGAEDFLPKALFSSPSAPELLDRAMRYAVTRHRQRVMLERESARLRWVTARQRQFIERVTTGMQGPVTAMYGLVSTLSERHRSLRAGERRLLLDKLDSNAEVLGRRLAEFIADAEPETLGSPRRGRVVMADIVPAAINAVGERPEGTHVSLAGNLPRVWGRAEAIQWAISELLRNAVVHASVDHPPVIRITVEGFGTGVRITVADDGPGIPPSRWSSVFEAGVTLDERSKREGLGLTRVRAIAAEHGGSVWVEESELGGNAVSMTIPQRETVRDHPADGHRPDATVSGEDAGSGTG